MPSIAPTTARCSMLMLLDISPLAPVRSTSARSSAADLVNTLVIPAAIAKIATSTPTTPAVPTMTTDDMPHRAGMLRMLNIVTARICFIGLGWFGLARSQRVDDRKSGRADCRHDTYADTQQQSHRCGHVDRPQG